MKKIFSLPFILFLFLQISCNPVFQSQNIQYKNYRIQKSYKPDSTLVAVMKPYADSVNNSMNEVIGIAKEELEKKQPSSTLGNFMTDAMLIMAKEKYGINVDAAFINYGGVRLTQLTAGPITKGKIFELMPFDNMMVIQKVTGDILQQFLDLIADRGGWPIAGITMEIKDKRAVNILIGGKPLNNSDIYFIANSDYIANGGDNADMLRPIPQQSNGYLIRDAILDYIKKLKSEGKNISANEEKRIADAQ